jgi:glycosyltransferase involved in cell wall biosynthesis
MRSPSVSAVVTAYNAEQYIGETLTSILSQTHPPAEVIVVDDGSSDGTCAELAPFRGDIRLVRQENRGHPNALNRGMREARGDYLAKCDADDIWVPDKLERQVEAILAHPEIDIAFSAIWIFGDIEQPSDMRSTGDTSEGILDPRRFAETLYGRCVICPSSTLLRRRLYERLGAFDEQLVFEDYDYWIRALRAGAVFYYDPATLVRYRWHAGQVTKDELRVRRSLHEVHSLHADLIDNRRLVSAVCADDLFRIGRVLVDQDCPREAREAFRRSLRYGILDIASVKNARALAWVALLTLPPDTRKRAGSSLVRFSRGIDNLLGVRQPRAS